MRPDRRARAPGPVRRSLTLFLAVPLLVLAAVAVVAALVSEQIARATALSDARETAVALTRFLVAPVLEEAMNGQLERWGELNARVRNRLVDQSIKSVIVWTSTGSVLWASDRRLVGQSFAATPELRGALDGSVESDVDQSSERDYPGAPAGRIVEVYAPLRIGGKPLVVETNFGFESIAREAGLLRSQLIPLAVGGLVALQLVQEPIGLSLLRRVRRQDAERTELLARSLTAADRERRAIAADVHDQPVQDLAGVGYALAALRPNVPAEVLGNLDRLGGEVRETVAWLRRLMVELYPPELSGAAIPDALEDLAASARAGGRAVTVNAHPVPGLPPSGAALLYRTAKEALVEAAGRHDPGQIGLTYGPAVLHGEPAARLQVGATDAAQPGPIPAPRVPVGEGLSLLQLQAADLDGWLRVDAHGVVAIVPAVGRPPD
jgi:two-component system, NarL family, sensor kinase